MHGLLVKTPASLYPDARSRCRPSRSRFFYTALRRRTSRRSARKSGVVVAALKRPHAGDVIAEKSVSLAPLAGRSVAVIGYGTMGRAHAVNLRRSHEPLAPLAMRLAPAEFL